MATNDQLQAQSKKQLIEQARELGISDPAHLRKDDLIRAILLAIKKKTRPEEPKAAPEPTAKPAAAKPEAVKPSAAAKPATAKPAAATSRPAAAAKPAARAATPAPANGGGTAKASPDKPSVSPSGNAAPRPMPAPATANRTVSPPSEPKPRMQKTASRDTTDMPITAADQDAARARFETVGPPTRDLSARVSRSLPNGYGKDKIVVLVRDPYWLHVYWELTHQAVQRAEAALALDWHGAKPILRLYDVSAQDTTSTAERPLRDIVIHGGVNHWYVEAPEPPRQFRIDIGYLSRRGQFFVLAHSPIVKTPVATLSENLDDSFNDIDPRQADRIAAMSSGSDPASGNSLEIKQLLEERFRRPAGTSPTGGSGATADKTKPFSFEIEAELILFGRTEPNSRVTLLGEPIKVRPDGTFFLPYSLPNSRQIIPAVAASADGIHEQTIILALERNTRKMEVRVHDGDD